MADFIDKKLNGELSYETPCIVEMTLSFHLVQGTNGSGDEYGLVDAGDEGVIPEEIVD